MDEGGVLHASDDEQVITQTSDTSKHAGMVLVPAGSFR